MRSSKDLIGCSSRWQNFNTIFSSASSFLAFCFVEGNMCFWGLRLVFGIAQLGFILIDPRKACDVFLNHYLSNPPRNISLCIWPSYASFRAFQLCFDPKFLCSKRFSTDKARPGSVTILFLAPSRFWWFLLKDQEKLHRN